MEVYQAGESSKLALAHATSYATERLGKLPCSRELLARYLAEPGEDRGCATNTGVIQLLSDWVKVVHIPNDYNKVTP